MIYTIKNKQIVVEINDFGAELHSIKKRDDSYEYLWQGNPSYWKRRAPILFPIVGKLKNDDYTYNDTTFHMTQHGFARDYQFELLESGDDFIAFKLKESVETLSQYPFKFELILSYTLKGEGIVVGYTVINCNSVEMPFSIGAHPAFNWDETEPARFAFKEQKLETLLLTDDGVSRSKEQVTMQGHSVLINQSLFKNDALILEDIDVVSFINGCRRVEMMFKGFPYLGLWSKPTGAPFVCIEPWYGIADFTDADGILVKKEGMQVLAANQQFNAEYLIIIS